MNAMSKRWCVWARSPCLKYAISSCPSLTRESAEGPVATLVLHSHVGLHMYSSGDVGSHTDVSPLPLHHRPADTILMGLGSIYVTGLTKYDLCSNTSSRAIN